MRRNLSEPSPEYTMPQQYSSSPNFLDWVHMRRKKERKSKPCPLFDASRTKVGAYDPELGATHRCFLLKKKKNELNSLFFSKNGCISAGMAV